MRKKRLTNFSENLSEIVRSKDMEISKIWQNFEVTLIAKNRSEKTISTYEHQIQKFYRHVLKTDLPIHDMTFDVSVVKGEDVKDFFVYMTIEKGLKPSSIVGMGKCLSVWFQFVSKNYNMSDLSPFVIIPKTEHVVLWTPTDNDIQEHLSSLDLTSFVEFRLYVMYQFVLNTGVRLGELQIRMNQLDMKERTVLIHGKGNKQRKVSINDKLYPILEVYLRERETFAKTDYLFVSEHGKQLQQSSISAQVKKFCKYTGYPINLHSCRRKFITDLLNNNVNPMLVASIVGHASPQVILQSYYNVRDSDVKDSMNTLKLRKK